MIHDISILVQPGTPEWPGDVPFSCGWSARIDEGASINLSHVEGSPHVGTHADAPLHVHDRWPASHELPLERFIGPAFVLDVDRAPDGPLELDVDDPRFGGCERLLLRTGRTIADGVFPASWPVLSRETVLAFIANGVTLVGVDCPSVDERASKTLEVHRTLFEGGAYVLENLDLRSVPEGRYRLIALPQRLYGLDAAPVRAVLMAP